MPPKPTQQQQRQVSQRTTMEDTNTAMVAPRQGEVRTGGRKYGDIDDSQEVHDEIIELGKQVKQQLRKYNPQNESDMLAAMREFGVSEQSKQMMRKEMEGAQMAMETGLYVVWRNVNKPMKSYNDGRTNECCRVGPSHKCFCGHTLQEHAALTSTKKGQLPKCSSCACSAFCYVPNMPEEVGDGHLSRRAGFNPATWSAKCRCGHGSLQHDGTSKWKKCRSCGCGGFDGQFMCAVCDGKWDDHVTILEDDRARRAEGRTTGAEYRPLAQVDAGFTELVFGSGAPQLEEGQQHQQQQQAIASSRPPVAATGRQLPPSQQQQQRMIPSSAQASGAPAPQRGGGGGGGDPFAPPSTSCPHCGTGYRTERSKFCSQCGAPRAA